MVYLQFHCNTYKSKQHNLGKVVINLLLGSLGRIDMILILTW